MFRCFLVYFPLLMFVKTLLLLLMITSLINLQTSEVQQTIVETAYIAN